jgi:hypothetical protein
VIVGVETEDVAGFGHESASDNSREGTNDGIELLTQTRRVGLTAYSQLRGAAISIVRGNMKRR